MVKTIKKKLQSSSGESIAEVLVAALVVSLGSILLISMVNASFNLLTAQEKKYREFISKKNDFEEKRYSEFESNILITINGGEVTISKTVDMFSKVVDEDASFYRYEARND